MSTTPKPDSVITFSVTCIDDVLAYANEHLNDGQCYPITICFGLAITSPYKCPSAIPYGNYGDTYQFGYKYWRSGQFVDFPKKTKLKYESTGLGISD